MSLPFRIPNVYGGLAEGRGILKVSRDGLILEFEVKEAIFNTVQLHANEVRIPMGEIAALEFAKGWFSARITLRVNNLRTLQEVPGSNAGELQLRIARKHKAQAEAFVSDVSMALTTLDLKRMEEDTRGLL